MPFFQVCIVPFRPGAIFTRCLFSCAIFSYTPRTITGHNPQIQYLGLLMDSILQHSGIWSWLYGINTLYTKRLNPSTRARAHTHTHVYSIVVTPLNHGINPEWMNDSNRKNAVKTIQQSFKYSAIYLECDFEALHWWTPVFDAQN